MEVHLVVRVLHVVAVVLHIVQIPHTIPAEDAQDHHVVHLARPIVETLPVILEVAVPAHHAVQIVEQVVLRRVQETVQITVEMGVVHPVAKVVRLPARLDVAVSAIGLVAVLAISNVRLDV